MSPLELKHTALRTLLSDVVGFFMIEKEIQKNLATDQRELEGLAAESMNALEKKIKKFYV
jgi:hypothetical protein